MTLKKILVTGGSGYMSEYPTGRLYAEARVGRGYGGSSEAMRELSARSRERAAR